MEESKEEEPPTSSVNEVGCIGDCGELPFLVTHWLANYSTTNNNDSGAALQRVRNAASSLALAFQELGAYGTFQQPNLQSLQSSFEGGGTTRAASYADIARQHPNIPPHQLSTAIKAVANTSFATEAAAQDQVAKRNLMMAMREKVSYGTTAGGRRLGDKIDLTLPAAETAPVAISVLQPPSLLGRARTSAQSSGDKSSNTISLPQSNEDKDKIRTLSVPIQSDYRMAARLSSKATREYIAVRDTFLAEQEEIKTLRRSLSKQELSRQRLLRDKAAAERTANVEEKERHIRSVGDGLQNCHRVTTQLTLKLSQVTERHSRTHVQLEAAKRESKDAYRQSNTVLQRYHDPFRISGRGQSSRLPVAHLSSYGSPILVHVLGRQYGIRTLAPSPNGVRKAVAQTRMAHSVTINAHLNFPIYCLQVDRTGRYFVTGADDCLVKLFYLGAAMSTTMKEFTADGSRQPRLEWGANAPGAVLVTTLRGHAGVICDIDISHDNAFIATASDDGDVRVWGLKDGCPIAVLRGHAGGANMVTWSSTTPYRLVSSGMDGLSRIWDVREAALKRYGNFVGKRPEYLLPLLEVDDDDDDEEPANDSACATNDDGEEQTGQQGNTQPAQEMQLPPLPGAGNGQAAVADPAAGVALPMGPGALGQNLAADANQAPAGNANAQIPAPGAFLFNDNLDEGVRIVAKQQHGNPEETLNLAGPGTRSRRTTVKVICVDRCPLGGHFATGSDDGQCRLWEDRDDDRLLKVDGRFDHRKAMRASTRRSIVGTPQRDPSVTRLLCHFTGHMSAITDLKYSHTGDRILTASQKDGNARIWSWKQPTEAKISDIKQIVLRLSSTQRNTTSRPTGRRRGGGSSNSEGHAITCDVAVWSSDDSKVITSQCQPKKGSGQDVVPGSQVVFIWDSWTGSCLMGISSAHEKQCPVVIPHPFVPSIICTAGADGFAKVWDLESGKCMMRYENKIDFGPVARSNEREKRSGYLDGVFDSSGNVLILTDDNGRVSLFDCLKSPSTPQGATRSAPGWMREQYFANDYYELSYDTNGYCIERGSGLPPHLAPKSVRCNHSGAPWREDVTNVFGSLSGPLPLPEANCRKQRNEVRVQATDRNKLLARGRTDQRRAIAMGEYDPSRTLLIAGGSDGGFIRELPQPGTPTAARARSTPRSNVRNVRTSTATFSRNFRWLDIEDMERELANAGDEQEDDEEEFVLPGRRADTADSRDDELSEGFESEVSSDGSGAVLRRGTRSRSGASRSNRSGRQRRRRQQQRERNSTVNEEAPQAQATRFSTRTRNAQSYALADEDDDEDDGFAEVWSTNTTPSGPFLADYEVRGHFFRLPNNGLVRRRWLQRESSAPSFKGTKDYAPQVGDSVIYVPRAHAETIKDFPTLESPWRHWPTGSRWPLVRCRVQNVRYRFPYKDYYRPRSSQARCISIVAIITLEVTGIPEMSNDRQFPWPKPRFISRQSRTRSTPNTFEVSMFESDCPEFVIPERLFAWRVETLEAALRANDMDFAKVDVLSYWKEEEGEEDKSHNAYSTKLLGVSAQDSAHGDHMSGSGFESLIVKWGNVDDDDDDDEARASPWELTVSDALDSCPPAPLLGDDERRAVSLALRKIEEDPAVAEYYSSPVNERKYSDYSLMVEVPIDFNIIKRRFAMDFYTNVGSIVSDVRLIRDNSIKYNGAHEELAAFAAKAADDFVDLLKKQLGDNFLEVKEQEEALVPEAVVEAANERAAEAARRVSRQRNIVSSLEQLPPPGAARGTRSTARGAVSREADSAAAEADDTFGQFTTETSESSRGRIRTRPCYAEVPDDSEEEAPEPAPKRSRRSATAARRRNPYVDRGSSAGDDEIESDEEISSPARARRSKERTSYVDHGSSGADDDEEDEDDESQLRRSTRRPSQEKRRATRSAMRVKEEVEESQEEEDDDDEEEEEEEEIPKRNLRRPSVRGQQPTRRSSRRLSRNEEEAGLSDDEEGDYESDQPTRRMTTQSARPSRRSARRVHDDEDEFEEESEAESDEDDYIETKPPPRRRQSPKKGKATKRKATRRSQRGRKADSEDEESSIDSFEAFPSEDEEVAFSPPKKKTRSSPKKKKREELPVIVDWPDIDRERIEEVTEAVLNHLTELDENEIFARPVVDVHPEIKASYLTVIEEPMDFETIREERVYAYESVRELQSDLILCFQNCVDFNGSTNVFGHKAKFLHGQLNDIFRNVCKECGILLPRRWK